MMSFRDASVGMIKSQWPPINPAVSLIAYVLLANSDKYSLADRDSKDLTSAKKVWVTLGDGGELKTMDAKWFKQGPIFKIMAIPRTIEYSV
jgi:hypothetical protein